MINKMKMIGIIPIHFNYIENKYPNEMDSCNITRMFLSNNNKFYITKKIKTHKEPFNIIETFNKAFDTDIKLDNCQLINYGWLENIQLYLLIIEDYTILSKLSIHNTTFHKETFCWKVFIDRFKETKETKDIYKLILNNNGIYKNVILDYHINSNNTDNIQISIEEIYKKMLNTHIKN